MWTSLSLSLSLSLSQWHWCKGRLARWGGCVRKSVDRIDQMKGNGILPILLLALVAAVFSVVALASGSTASAPQPTDGGQSFAEASDTDAGL